MTNNDVEDAEGYSQSDTVKSLYEILNSVAPGGSRRDGGLLKCIRDP